jgi:hypothetical protein
VRLYGCVFAAMPSNNRSYERPTLGAFGYFAAIVLCCFIVGILTYGQGRENERRHQAPASYAKAAMADAQNACVGREGTAAFECIYEKVEAAQEQARGEQDLSAQQKAANAALISAIVAFFTLILSGVGVWYVRGTLRATLKAVEDTGKATEAMLEANRIARSGKRPIMTLVGGGIRYQEFLQGDQTSAMVYVLGNIRNIGDAVGILMYVDLELFCDEQTIQRGSVGSLENPLLLPGEVTGPRGGFWGGGGGPAESVAKYAHPTEPLETTLKLRVKIRYRDLYGIFRENGCYFVRGNNVPGRPFMAYGGPDEWYDREMSKEEAYKPEDH